VLSIVDVYIAPSCPGQHDHDHADHDHDHHQHDHQHHHRSLSWATPDSRAAVTFHAVNFAANGASFPAYAKAYVDYAVNFVEGRGATHRSARFIY
jgi:ABC-type Zn2+ transport system substrate-binding protein/surface adhesin